MTGQELNSPARLRHQWLVRSGSFKGTTSARPRSRSRTPAARTSTSCRRSRSARNRSGCAPPTPAAWTGGRVTVQVNYFPPAMGDRLRPKGGAAVFGNFLFGEEGPRLGLHLRGLPERCWIAVRRSVAAWCAATSSPSGFSTSRMAATTRVWAARLRSSGPSRLTGASRQDFQNGRLYGFSSASTYYVNPVFTQAIDALGGEAATGTPTADPTSDSRSPYLVWQFQPFRKLDALGRRDAPVHAHDPGLLYGAEAPRGASGKEITRSTGATFR